jgi:tryptophan 2,3-dioxygenase
MDRERFYASMNGQGDLDYEIYLNTRRLLTCQKEPKDLVNADELQFQIVHQSAELWMKLAGYTLLDVDDHMAKRATNRVITLLGRAHKVFRLLNGHFDVLETMSPKEYQEIRSRLGNGSGQESPGFRMLLDMAEPLWQSYVRNYLEPDGLTVEAVYDSRYDHGDAYVVAEALIEYDELFHKFRYHHIQLIHRSIGIRAHSLTGRSVEVLDEGLRQRFFQELWDIRGQMTDSWGATHGLVRESLGQRRANGGEGP